jgi:hypothetical protein
MARKKKSEWVDEVPAVTDTPEQAPNLSVPARVSHTRGVKEFDLKAAHHAWKERHGIDDGW